MPRTEKELEGISLLGNQHTQYKDNYSPEMLETFENKHPENEYLVTLDCPEFTTLCPKTGQPDFSLRCCRYHRLRRSIRRHRYRRYHRRNRRKQ